MQRAVDCDNVALAQHLFKILDSSAANLLFDLRLERLVVEVQQLLAVEWLQSSKHTLANAADSHCSDHLILKIKLVLGDCGHIPVAALNLLVGWDEVSDEEEDGHNDVLGDRDNIGAGNFSDCDAAIGLVGSVQIDVVGANASGDGDLEVLGLLETLGGQVTRVEAGESARFPTVMLPTYGVVMMTSASTSSLSNLEPSPSLSEVVTRVCPWSSSHFLIPSSFSVVPRSRGCSLACSWP